MGQQKYSNGFKLTLHPGTLELPLKWKKPQRIFVNFQVLTKRSGRLLALTDKLDWPPNLWMGVSVESIQYKTRIDHLRKTGAKLKFLSLEPLLGPLGALNLRGIDWVIVGGESGPGARPMDAEWVLDVRRQCERADVPFFFKQWGGAQKKRTGRKLNGRTYDEMPVPLQTASTQALVVL
jgi:protein gp37